MDSKCHAAGAEDDAIVWVSHDVVEKNFYRGDGVLVAGACWEQMLLSATKILLLTALA